MPASWDDLRFLLAVSRARSFQAAARQLQVTHTTVGRRIAALETRMRQPLFLREDKVCVPTPAGARLIAAATRIEQEIRQARADTGGGPAEPEGLVRIVSVNWVVNDLLLPDVGGLRAQFPAIRLQLHGTLDDAPDPETMPVISLRFETKPARGEEVIPVARVAYSVYAPEGCADPDALPWVSFGGSAPLAWLRRQGVPPEAVALSVNDAGAVRSAVAAGIGRGLMPDCLAERMPGLRRQSGPAPEFVRILRAVGRRGDLLNDPGATVLHWAAERLAAAGCAMPAVARGTGARLQGRPDRAAPASSRDDDPA